ncbi:MAG: hypothetical protein M4579_000659 [Chaenotheca gracillima]|nr:MAG: hypothetical protein M4579_000659 [Chaenotheca gracillima]
MVPSTTSKDEHDRYRSSSDSDTSIPADRRRPSPSRRDHSRPGPQGHHTPVSSPSSSSVEPTGSAQEFPLSPSLVPLAYGSGPKGQWGPDDRLPVFTKGEMSGRQQRRPLIDLVRNDWMNESMYGQKTSPTADRSEPSYLEMIRAPRLRRYVLLYAALMLSFIVGFRWLEPRFIEYHELNVSLGKTDKSANGVYGVNLRPQFKDMIHSKTLDETLIPVSVAAGKSASRKRLVIVGDIHGCKDELTKLLEKVSFDKKNDHLISTGDMITKGPDSLGVVDMLQDMGASCVRGNHEDRVLLLHRQMNIAHVELPGPDENVNRTNDDLEEESFNHGDYKDRALASELSRKQFEFLKECPVILRVGTVDQLGELVVVHAGLAAGVDLKNQDPFNVMNMRTVDLETHVPSVDHDGMAWSKLWNRYQNRLPSSDRTTVIYGHDAKRGLQIGKYSKGIDSGCLRGGKLTAFVIESGTDGQITSNLVDVQCENYIKRNAPAKKPKGEKKGG